MYSFWTGVSCFPSCISGLYVMYTRFREGSVMIQFNSPRSANKAQKDLEDQITETMRSQESPDCLIPRVSTFNHWIH